MTGLNIAIRPRRAGDKGFIFRSWLKAYRKSLQMRHVPSRVYFADVHSQIEGLLAAEGRVQTLMAVSCEDDDFFYGFACTERLDGSTLVLHMAYTKKESRRQGVFRQLATAAGLNLDRPFFYTHHTPIADQLARRFPHAIYRRDLLGLPR